MVKGQTTVFLSKKSSMLKNLAQKVYGKPSRSKNIQTGMFCGIGTEIKKIAEKTDIEKTDGNSLMAKAMARKRSTFMTLSIQLQ